MKTIYKISFSALRIYILKALELQLFIMFFSWPILLWWGLPLSIVSPIGNIIFTPFLSLFLLLSTFTFFLEILYIPNTYIIYLLELLTLFWQKILSYSCNNWLFYSTKPSLILLILMPIIACIFIQSKKNILLLTLGTLSIAGYLTYSTYYKDIIITLERGTKELKLIKSDNSIIAIDNGTLNGKSLTSFITYKLTPELVKNMGSCHIDKLITLKVSIYTLRNLKQLCTQVSINTIYIPKVHKKLTKAAEIAYQDFNSYARNNNITIIELKESTHPPLVNNKGSIMLIKNQATKGSFLNYNAYISLDYNTFNIQS